MQLSKLVRALGVFDLADFEALVSALPPKDVVRVTDKSRNVVPGTLFVAYPGVNVDGAQFIPDALERGAVAVVTQTPVAGNPSAVNSTRSAVTGNRSVENRDQSPVTGDQSPVPILVVPDGRAALAYLAAAFYKNPSRNLRVIGVTGTDGKTTTSTLIENILLAAGHTVGTITTVAAHIGGREVDTGFHTTTPDAPEIQNYLAQMVERGTEYAVVESTSHGLAQRRLEAVDFDIAVVTNITHEHLDLHGTWENYRDAKALLLRALETTHRKPRTAKVAVLNADDNARGVFDFLHAISADERVIYGQAVGEKRVARNENEIWISARDIESLPEGLRFVVDTPFGELPIESPLIGRYNVSNILAAVGAAIGRRIPFEAIAQGVKITRGIVGRMELVPSPRDFTVIVDFAHTPNALENALKTARELVGAGTGGRQGRVIALFGCAGLRDVQKRAWMGEIAGRNADLTIVTAEDPRTEALAEINAQIAEGLHKANRERDVDYFVVDDRGEAINFAINHVAQRGDVVMICGKGHERSMCFGTTETPWSDQDAARAALTVQP